MEAPQDFKGACFQRCCQQPPTKAPKEALKTKAMGKESLPCAVANSAYSLASEPALYIAAHDDEVGITPMRNGGSLMEALHERHACSCLTHINTSSAPPS